MAGLLGGAAALAGPRQAEAQMLRGRVVDSETGGPVAGASVSARGGLQATSDSMGRFELSDLSAGELSITIDVIGYAREMFKIEVPDRGFIEWTFPLDFTGYRLPEIVIEGRAEVLAPRYADFELRRQRDIGAFVRWDELARKGFGSIGDALRGVRGVRIQCNQQAFECFVVMSRTPNCLPTWWIDGVEVRSFHENTPIRDIYGIEVYRGPGEIPAEFAGSNAACGVIVVWTKSRPFR